MMCSRLRRSHVTCNTRSCECQSPDNYVREEHTREGGRVDVRSDSREREDGMYKQRGTIMRARFVEGRGDDDRHGRKGWRWMGTKNEVEERKVRLRNVNNKVGSTEKLGDKHGLKKGAKRVWQDRGRQKLSRGRDKEKAERGAERDDKGERWTKRAGEGRRVGV